MKKINMQDFISQEKYIVFLAIYNIIKSFASIEKVITIFYLFAFYRTQSLNNFII